MDIIEALQNHHEEIRNLLLKAGFEKKRLPQLRKYLEVHHRNEEFYFLNHILGKQEVQEPAAEAVEEHYYITLMLADLENFPKDHKRWPVKYSILQEFIEHHMREEEEEIFREVRKFMHKKDLAELGGEYETVTKRQLESL